LEEEKSIGRLFASIMKEIWRGKGKKDEDSDDEIHLISI